MDDETTGEERLDHLSDQEWADAIFKAAHARSAAEGSWDSPSDVPSAPVTAPVAEEAASTEFSDSGEREPTSSRPRLVTREEIAPVPEQALYADPVESFSGVTPSSAGSNRELLSDQKRIRRVAIEWGLVITGALVMALLVKAFLFQAYYIPSPSMEPTLSEGDRIVVNKLSYRLHNVNRGDLVVFKAPDGTGGVDDLIKRVIGLPGELLRVVDGRILINDGMLLEPYLALQDSTASWSTPSNCANLPGDVDGCRIPPDHVFVMGDHRANSRDSRFFGVIPEDSIRGRAFLRIWPLGEMRRL